MLFSIGIGSAAAIPITTWKSKMFINSIEEKDPKFDMSVSINPQATQVLVGIQSINTVFLFNYSTTTLTLVTSLDNGRGIGFGKGVAWLNDTFQSIAILANVYSSAYVWSSSKIYIYNSPLMSTSTPASIFPNIQQQLYADMSSVFLNIVTTPDHLVLIVDEGYLFVILSARSGYYSTAIGSTLQALPSFSSELPCIPGTYKNTTSIHPCQLCPTGTKNDGTNLNGTTCVSCAMNAFCPLGSISDSISNDQFTDVIQVVNYPKSPTITGLDDILFFTVFSIGSTGRCVVLSPIFWTLIVAAILFLIASVMLVIKYCAKDRKAGNSYKTFRKVFKRADLIREGEMWCGGLATLCILVLCIGSYVFSAKYYTSYPIETAGPSTYTCDTTIRNAQFSTSLQPVSIPVRDNIQELFNLLNNQEIILNISFINTIYNCTSEEITLEYLLGSTWTPFTSKPTCTSSNYVVSYSVRLQFKMVDLQFKLPNTYNIGGFHISVSARGQNKSSKMVLKSLAFSKMFNQSQQMLGHDVYLALQLTKVINSTSPLVSSDDEILSGIWMGSFTINYYESFIRDVDYLNLSSSISTTLTMGIIEMSYYILNEQSPIARLPEIIYHDFLFMTMIIGMFVLVFVIYEVLVLPCLTRLIGKCKSKADDDLENSFSSSNKQDYISGHKRDDSTVNSVAFRKQIWPPNRYLPPMSNHQAYL